MKALFAIIPLLAILVLALYFMVSMWSMIPGNAMNQHGWFAMILGIIGSLVVGGGLMFLLFSSSRGGHDEAADFRTTVHREIDPDEKQQG